MSNLTRSQKQPYLHRRTLLKGIWWGAPVTLGLPLFEAMLNRNGTALAAGAPLPLRFGVFHWGGGVRHADWVPKTTGTGFDLPPSLLDFADLRRHLTLVTGTNHAFVSPGHIPARGIALSSSHDTSTGIGGGGTYRGQNMPEPSIDQLVAEAWGNKTQVPLIAARVCDKGPYASNSSWKRGGTTYNRHEREPATLFTRLFGGPLPDRQIDVPTASKARTKSVLDALKADATDLKRNLGRTDQMRLDQHLSGLRDLEQRLLVDVPPGGSPVCRKPENRGASSKSERAKLHADVIAHALACDLTRIVSFEWSANQSMETYPEVGMNQEHHEFTHGNSQSELHGKVIRFIMQHLAYLGTKLAMMPEGSGNVLDTTLILGTSEHADAGAHNFIDHPFILLGRAGGRLKGNLHYRDPNAGGTKMEPANKNAPKVLLTAVNALGITRDKLGQTGREASGLVSEILT